MSAAAIDAKCIKHGADRWLLRQRSVRVLAVRNAGARQSFAQDRSLGVGAVEDGEIGEGKRCFPSAGAPVVDHEEARPPIACSIVATTNSASARSLGAAWIVMRSRRSRTISAIGLSAC